METSIYIAGWRERARAEDAAQAARAQTLRAAAGRAAQALMELGATRVWLFGSLVRGHVHAHSDIDLACEGMPARELLVGLLRAEEAVGPGVTVDLVRVEEARLRLRAVIHAGEVLLER